MGAQRRQVLLLAAMLALGVTLVPQAEATSGGFVRISVHLKKAPFEAAVRQLFSGQMFGFANYVIESGPAEGSVATAELADVVASEALAAVLGQYGLSYRWIGGTVWIFEKRTQAEPERGLLLYLSRNGDRTQVRLRAYPYEKGGEKLLWESPKDIFQYTYLLPSPSFKWVAVAWQGRTYSDSPRLFVVPLLGGETKEIAVPRGVASFVWTKDEQLDIKGEGDSRWRCNPVTGTLTTGLGEGGGVQKAAYANQIRALAALLDKVELPFDFPTSDLESTVLAASHDPLNQIGNIKAPAQAAVSPDGRHAALVGAEAAVYVFDVTTGAVTQKIPATRLVQTEAVALGQLHWSLDGRRLLFTESHYHAARFHGMGGPAASAPSVTDWTDLVRQYSPAAGQTKTLAAGYDAYLVPAEAARELLANSNPRDWQAGDDQRRWGRYAEADPEGAESEGP